MNLDLLPPLPDRPDTWDLTQNRLYCAQAYLYQLAFTVDDVTPPDAEQEEDRVPDPERRMALLCDSLERLQSSGEALEFAIAARDLLEALADAHSGDPSISALAHADDAWQTATERWGRWRDVARGRE